MNGNNHLLVMMQSTNRLLKSRVFKSFRGGQAVAATASALVLYTFSVQHQDVRAKDEHAVSAFDNQSTRRTQANNPLSFWTQQSLVNTRFCACESISQKPSSTSSVTSKPLSRMKLLLYKSKLLPYSYLPVPRLLTPNDPLFEYPEFRKGLRQRKKDEILVNKLLTSKELREARETQNQRKMHSILDEMHTLLYGKGVTPQVREDFLIQNGCTGYTPEVLEFLIELGKGRGFVEIGAGNGQWARALIDCHVGYCEKNEKQISNNSKSWEFVTAYDNGEALPLSPKIYHARTKPAHRHFYPNVKHCESHTDVVQGYASRGRILLLVFPPPAPMALETIKAYVNAYKENDTVVYVGEGRGGANGSDELFDYFLGKIDPEVKWALVKVMDVKICPGGKGYEKMFVFKRVQ